MNNKRIGKKLEVVHKDGKYSAYIPNFLPPNPPINISSIYPLLDKTNTAIQRLDDLSVVLPDASLFLYPPT